ncbi:MAG: hypothetical protein Q7U47_06090 [Paludibacter sp.]|nr:hypothetical protein [Paludibacter sp.]
MNISQKSIVVFFSMLELVSQSVAFSQNEPIHKGKFEPTWQSLQQYKVPD